jgi:hypothetical protein
VATGAEGATSGDTSWFVGRDGQQYGPVADTEFRSLLASGQVLPTDLVWRQGMADWVQADTLRASLGPSAGAPPPQAAAASFGSHGDADNTARQAVPSEQEARADATDTTARSGSTSKRAVSRRKAEPPKARARRKGGILRGMAWAAIVLFFAVTLGAAYFVVVGDKTLARIATVLIPSFGERVPVSEPLGGYVASSEGTDAAMQKGVLWQVLKRNHAEWYAERVREASEAVRAGKPPTEITANLMTAVAALRRQYAGDAISAPMVRLKSIASLFASSLGRMKAISVDACYQFVTAGESAPAIVAQLQAPEVSSVIQAELAAIFEGIGEGRRTPRVYPQPRQADYDVLIAALEQKGWKKDDLQLFADSQRLSQAPPETVCRLVTEWFEAQLSIKEPDIQLRLLVDSLKPVVAG